MELLNNLFRWWMGVNILVAASLGLMSTPAQILTPLKSKIQKTSDLVMVFDSWRKVVGFI